MLRIKHLQRLLTTTTGHGSSQNLIKLTKQAQQHQLISLAQRNFINNRNTNQSPDNNEGSQRQRPRRQQGQGGSEGNQIENFFHEKYGKSKSELLDSWLEMDNSNLMKECNNYNLKASESHIENIQILFDYIKQEEQKFMNRVANGQDSFKKVSLFKKQDEFQNEHIHEEIEKAEKHSHKASSARSDDNPQGKTQAFSIFNKKTKTSNNEKKSEQPDEAPQENATQQKRQQDKLNLFQSKVPQQTLNRDIDRAKENLNDQLSKILAKRKKLQDNADFGAKLQNDWSKTNAAVRATYSDIAEDFIHNPYKADFKGSLLSILKKRDVFVAEPNQREKVYTGSSDNQKLIDNIFGMKPEELHERFDYLSSSLNHPVLSKLNVSTDDYQKLQGITKKRVLMNIEQITSNFIGDVNKYLPFEKDKTFEFAYQNLSSLNDNSKEHLAKMIAEISNNISKNKVYFSDINKSHSFVVICKDLNLPFSEQLKQSLIYNATTVIDYDHADSTQMFDKVADIVNFVSSVEDQSLKPDVTKIREKFQTNLKRFTLKKGVKQFTFNELLNVTNAIPKVDHDTTQPQKMFQHQLLNEIVASENALNWEKLDKEQVFKIVDRCLCLPQMRDLINRLKNNLLHVTYTDFTLSDFTTLCDQLSEGGKSGKIDIKMVTEFFKKQGKTAMYVPNVNQLKELIVFYETIFRLCPLAYASLQTEMKLMISQINELQNMQRIDVNDAVKFSKIFISSLFSPNFLFKDFIDTHARVQQPDGTFKTEPVSLKNNVDLNDLKELISNVNKRMQESMFSFEHLLQSHSKVHKLYRPYTQNSVLMMIKVIQDFTQQGPASITREELQVINKILENEVLTKIAFVEHERFLNLTKPVLDYTESSLNERNTQAKEIAPISVPFKIEEWDSQVKALSNVLSLTNDIEIGQQVLRIVHTMSDVLKSEYLTASDLAIQDILKLNKSVLDLAENLHEFSKLDKSARQDYQKGIQSLKNMFKEVVEETINFFYFEKKPFVMMFTSQQVNKAIQKKIQLDTDKNLIEHNQENIIAFMLYNTPEKSKELAALICNKMSNGRRLVGKDLINLFKMIDKYGIHDDVKVLMVNEAANLETIDYQEIKGPAELKPSTDPVFSDINDKNSKKDYDMKLQIIRKFEHISNNDEHGLLRKEFITLRPLSKLMADVFDQQTDEDILSFFQILGNEKIDNYHEDFIKKIYERYSNQQKIDHISTSNPKFFFKFAKQWPYFLKNNSILKNLLEIKSASALPQQQQEILSILTQQNVKHPEMLKAHFETFIKMKDKDSVSKYMRDYIHQCAFLGFYDFDISKFTQVFRRIYPTPEQVPSMGELLDYLVVLALSGSNYSEDFDEKSRKFILDAINYVEKKFTGIETFEFTKKDEITGEDKQVKITYYNSIPSSNKVYHKVQVQGRMDVSLDLEKGLQLLEQNNIDSESDTESDAKPADDKPKDGQTPPTNETSPTTNPDSQNAKKDTVASHYQPHQHEHTILHKQEEVPETQAELESALKDDKEAEQFQVEDIGAVEEHEKIKKIQDLQYKSLNPKLIYERKASESQYSEELEFHQYRKKKLEDMDKKSKHLLIFSNINQLNFKDINKSDVCKAWTVLFHFANKTFDSIIYDEFESIVLRNSQGKSKGHELFNLYYMKVLDRSYHAGFRVQLVSKCKQTGWPVDIQLSLGKGKSQVNVYLQFLLQEEVCLNAQTNAEDPLGVQQLMLKQMVHSQASQVCYITENQVYSAKDKIQEFADDTLEELLGIPAWSEEDMQQEQEQAKEVAKEETRLRFPILVVVAALSLIARAEDGEVEEKKQEIEMKVVFTSPNIKKVTEESFETEVIHPTRQETRNGDWILKFYSQKCPFCINFQRHYDALADEFAGRVNFGEVDCDVESLKPICYAFGVKNTPSISFLKDGHSYKFAGGPTYENVKAMLEGGYRDIEAKKLPKKRDTVNQYKKQLELYIEVAPAQIRAMFTSAGYGDLPIEVMYGLTALAALIPLLLLFRCLCCSKKAVKPVKPESRPKKAGAEKLD